MYKVDDKQQGTSAVYRAAFPAVRVFIYGHEVTDDIIDVRPNQAGGSVERSPGSCSLTLENRWDKYILTNADMQVVGEKKMALNFDISAEGLAEIFDSFNIDSLTSGHKRELDSAFSYQRRADPKYNFSILFLEEREKIDNNLKESDFYSSLLLKKSVIEKKMSFTSTIRPKKETNLVQYSARKIFDYPMQEGDCIFHPNDGIRVAMRDPFDPTVWYWSFTGFVDGFTEESDVNHVSTINLSCTDVSKMARYSYAKSFGYLDPSINDNLEGNLESGKTAVDTGIVIYQNIFEGFTIYEILETVFFGSESTAGVLDATALAEISRLSAEGVRDWDIYNYLIGHLDMTEQTAIKLMYGRNLPNASFYKEEDLDQTMSRYGLRLTRSDVTAFIKNKRGSGGEKERRLKTLNWAAVQHPSGITYKRKDRSHGVSAYFYGDTDIADDQVGKQIPTLYQWNEVLHHRVRLSDLDTMAFVSEEDDLLMGSAVKANTSIDQVIDIIGKNDEGRYPVGHGRIFYLAPAKLASRFGRSVVDRSFGGAPGMHTNFKDRLSFIYDLADYIEFRFYATPRGDMVFEMPFYDFSPYDFFDQRTVWEVGDETARIVKSYKTVFNKDYDGDYIEETGVTELGLVKQSPGYMEYDFAFNYDQHFTFEKYEQMGYSNSLSDNSMLTYFGAIGNTVGKMSSAQNRDLHKTQYAKVQELIPILGQRVGEAEAWGFIDTEEGVDIFTALRLNQANAEARSLGINISPKLGLMVNRPAVWKQRNYYANIVSIQHSLVWNSDMSTTVNINQPRGWTGEYDPDTLEPIYKHFGGDRPFNLSEFLVKGTVEAQRKGED